MERAQAASTIEIRPFRSGAWMTWVGMLAVAAAVTLVFGLSIEPGYQPNEPLLQPSAAWDGPLTVASRRILGRDTWRLGVGLHAASAALIYAVTVVLFRRARRGGVGVPPVHQGGVGLPPANQGRVGFPPVDAHQIPPSPPGRGPGAGQHSGKATNPSPARRLAAMWPPHAAGLTAGLLWGLHPLRVTVVFWAAWLGVLLSTLLALVALGAYLQVGGSARRMLWLLLALAAYAASLLAGPVALFLPLVILVLNVWPLGRVRRPRARAETLAFAAVAVVAAVGVGRELAAEDIGPPVAELGALQRIMLGVFAAGYHIGRTFWPFGLAAVNELALPVEATATRYLTAAALLIAGCTGAGALGRRVAAIPVALAAYLLLLLPAAGLIPIGPVETAWPQAYLASGAVLVLLGGLVGVGLERIARRTRGGAATIGVLIGVCAVGLVVLTRQHLACWRSAEEFWNAVRAVRPQSGLAYYVLAQEQEALGSHPRAVALYRAAGQNARWITGAHLAAARLLAEDGELAEAAQAYQRALNSGVQDAFVHRELAALLVVLDRPEQAEEHFHAALQRAPGDLRARRGLANLLIGQGRCDEALRVLGDPPPVDDAAYWYAIGRAHRCAGDAAAARRAFEVALEADPYFAAARRALGELD